MCKRNSSGFQRSLKNSLQKKNGHLPIAEGHANAVLLDSAKILAVVQAWCEVTLPDDISPQFETSARPYRAYIGSSASAIDDVSIGRNVIITVSKSPSVVINIPINPVPGTVKRSVIVVQESPSFRRFVITVDVIGIVSIISSVDSVTGNRVLPPPGVTMRLDFVRPKIPRGSRMPVFGPILIFRKIGSSGSKIIVSDVIFDGANAYPRDSPRRM